MATLSLKSAQRYSVPDWFANNNQISTNSESQRYMSHQIRQEGRGLRNETNNQTKWDQEDNTSRLADRMDDVERWKEHLEIALCNINAEIDALTKAKDEAERALEAKNLNLDVAIESLTLREGRQDIDLVTDQVHEQLLKEVEVINGSKKALQQKICQAFEQLCLLMEAHQQLIFDIKNKKEALNVDGVALSLNNNSPNISFKPNPLRIPPGSTTVQQWDMFSRYNRDRAEAEMKASKNLREAIIATIKHTDNEVEAQRVATDFAFRKRIHEFEQALNELKWQEKNILEEIADLEEEIRRLEADLRAKNAPLKVAHTRLETRTYRPNVDLTRDEAQYGLIDEVHQLEGTIASLKQKLAQSQDALTSLYKQLAQVQEDIGFKTHSLCLDNKSMDVRRKLTTPPEKYLSNMDSFTRTPNRKLSEIKCTQLDLL
ncbi:tektin-2 isoform X1 [Narcine bancroftii]|uniref:tektin-2 isoform X1 n=1 Tax=Narcine bancroftii TaxID=1343680 RepID=UPI0038317D53